MRPDLTLVCLSCRLRFAAKHERCPRCARTPLDLRVVADREAVQKACVPAWPAAPLRRVHRAWMAGSGWIWEKIGVALGDDKRFRWWWAIPGGMAALTYLGFVVFGNEKYLGLGFSLATVAVIWAFTSVLTMAAFGLLGLALAACVLLPGIIGLGVLRLVEHAVNLYRYRGRVAAAPRLAVHAEPPPRGKTVRGRVRLAEGAMRRVVGQAIFGEVDDVETVGFRFEAEENTVELAPTEVWLELEPDEAAQPLAFFPRAPVEERLRQARLRDGDLVEIEGPQEQRIESDGYRSQTVILRYLGPIVLRKALASPADRKL